MKWVNYPFKMEKQYRRTGWDYSKNVYYFITICTKDRINYFRDNNRISPVGTDLCVCSSNSKEEILGDVNPVGQMIIKWWCEIRNKFKSIEIDKFVIMSNHFHGILIINKENNNVGITNNIINKKEQTRRSVPTIDNNIFGNVGLLGQSIQWFKTMTTNEYIQNVKQKNWPKFHKQLWQSRFHNRIIRTQKEYWARRIYIENNPKNWNKDINNQIVILKRHTTVSW